MKLYIDHIKLWSMGVVAAVLFTCAGCSDDMGLKNGNSYETTPSDCLAFTTCLASENTSSATRSTVPNLEIVEEEWPLQTTREDSCATRGTLVKYLSGEAGVLGFQYDEGSITTPVAGGDNNLEFEFDGDKLVSKSTTIPWNTITEPHLNVYAYAPYVPATPTGTDGSMRLESTTTSPKIHYTVPDAISHQKDILVAKWISKDSEDPGNYKNKTIHLTFDHILTAIRFRVGFDCTVESVAIEGVRNSGTYDLVSGNDKWENVGSSGSSDPSGFSTYKIEFNDGIHNYLEVEKDQLLTHDDEYMILMPQALSTNAKIVLTCVEKNEANEDVSVEYTAIIGGEGKEWKPGRLITYTFYKKGSVPGTIYFDLALDNVMIDGNRYSGKVFKNGKEEEVSGEHESENHYYVYQSTVENRGGIWNGEVCTPPPYDRVKGPDGRPWSEYITNNTNVDEVIKAWDIKNEVLVTAAGRSGTNNRIHITGNVTCDLTIDNIYSTYQEYDTWRTTGGIAFIPTAETTADAKLTVNIVGDNRVGSVHYDNHIDNENEIIFEGTGSLTVADVDGNRVKGGYCSNYWNAAIGNHDNKAGEDASYGIVFNSGIIFAGTTAADNCTAIGGGGNATGKVIINGGTITAVATTTGTAIGGGIGYSDPGGEGFVEINGGYVYAYNFKNQWNIPSSAIGGAGSRGSTGAAGNVIISGGYVYAVSEGGTAIGGGSSYSVQGGGANITITGGEVFAKTGLSGSASIGGGTAYTQGFEDSDGDGKAPSPGNNSYCGGNANITIYGNPVIRTGSIGGGGTGDKKGKIGNAKIQISGGDISGQFILQAGTTGTPTFTMSGGMIRNSDTADEEYLHVQKDGGAVWLQNGTVEISGGTIRNCKATRGGAIYINGTTEDGTTSNASFTMSGGVIEDNEAIRLTGNGTGDSDDDFAGSGGAIYIIDGTVTLTGGTIADNMAAGGNGGGIFIRRGSLEVGGSTTIKGNSSEIREVATSSDEKSYAGGNGGGVYVYSRFADVDVNLESGTITGNTADRRGGGLCVIQESDEHEAKITIGTTNVGPEISWNRCLLQGGGVYVKGTKADITINNGTIENNAVSQYAHNEDVANEGGLVTLHGGAVNHRVITFNANDGSENPETWVWKIVTETNSRLVTPEFEQLGYYLVGWNTKPNGTGESYVDGQIVNTNKHITLYAQWKKWK